jgi:hypothetical protein
VEDVLLECALGKKTVNSGVSVVYEPAIALASFSLGHQVGHTVRFATGCVVEELRLEVVNKGAVKWSVSGPCAKLVHAGKGTTVAASTTTLIKLTSGEAKLFDVGSRVSVGSEDNSGAGYEVTAVDESADTITISPALSSAPSAGETVQGFLPTPSLAGDPLQGRLGRVEMDSAVLSISQASLTVRNEIKMLDDLLDDQDYPQGFIPGRRTVAGSVEAYFLREYLAHFRQAKSQTNVAINLIAGSTAGSILTVAFAQAQLNTPALSGDIEIKETLEFEGMPSSSFEDELSISYT